MADVEISYRGNVIGSLSASGSLDLLTAGKYCDDDITVDYTSPGGGGIDTYSIHTIEFTLDTSTSVATILNTYIKECGQWAIYPKDSSFTSLNTITTGIVWPQNKTVGSTTTPTGVSLNWAYQYYINDQTYNSIRIRANLPAKPAGTYILKFNGIAKT